MKYQQLLTEMGMIADDYEPVIEVELEKDDPVSFALGTSVRIATLEGLDPDDLGVTDSDFNFIKDKVAKGEAALIFNEDDELEYADVVFSDGIEAFGIPYSNLILVDEEEYIPSNTVDVDSI